MPEFDGISCIDMSRFFVLKEYKTVYLEIPKVACTSIKTWIAGLLGFELEPDSKHWEIHTVNLPMVVGKEMEKNYSDYFKFCFVRNPWDRLLSCWLGKIKTEDWDDGGKNWRKGVENNFWRYGDLFWTAMPFNDFINSVVSIPDNDADAHFRSQYTFMHDKQGISIMNFIGRMEKINMDFSYICQKIGAPEVKLHHLNVQKRKKYYDYYDSRTVKIVAERYAKDIELFKYEF